MLIRGRARLLGDDVSGAQIMPSKYLAGMVSPEALVRYLFEPVRADLGPSLEPGDIIVAGENFGGGSSREMAPRTMKQAGIPCVVAKSFGRSFYRSGINLGILPVESRIEVREMDLLEIDPKEGIITVNGDVTYPFQKYPLLMLDIILEGGLLNYYQKHGAL